jgi:hypothetical protein
MKSKKATPSLIIIFAFVLSFFSVYSQKINKVLLKSQIDSALNFIQNKQIKETVVAKQYAGEWPVDMHLTTPYFFIGRKDPFAMDMFSIFNDPLAADHRAEQAFRALAKDQG